MLKSFFIGLLLLLTFGAFADELIRNALVKEVANSNNGGAEFAIRLEGGTGICSTAVWITFPEASELSAESYRQSFAISMTAMLTNKKVRIHNFANNSCSEANFITITQ